MSTVHSPEYQDFLQRLQRARTKAGLTQVDVAQRLRKPQSYVSKSESGERRVDVIELLEFLHVYDANPAAFVRGLKPRKRPSR